MLPIPTKVNRLMRTLLLLPWCLCQHLGRGCRGIRGAGHLTVGAGTMCSFSFEFNLSKDAREWMMLHNWVWAQA